LPRSNDIRSLSGQLGERFLSADQGVSLVSVNQDVAGSLAEAFTCTFGSILVRAPHMPRTAMGISDHARKLGAHTRGSGSRCDVARIIRAAAFAAMACECNGCAGDNDCKGKARNQGRSQAVSKQ